MGVCGFLVLRVTFVHVYDVIPPSSTFPHKTLGERRENQSRDDTDLPLTASCSTTLPEVAVVPTRRYKVRKIVAFSISS